MKHTRRQVATVVFGYIIIFLLALPSFLLITGRGMDSILSMDTAFLNRASRVGWGMVIAGLLLMIVSMGQLVIAGKGYPISHLPPKTFVVSGFYKIVRHPIYAGFVVLISGCAIIIESPGMLLVSLPLLVAAIFCYIRFYEEPVLIDRFGESYRIYREKVPSLFPRLIPRRLSFVINDVRQELISFIGELSDKVILFSIGDALFVTYGLLTTIGIVIFIQHSAITLFAQGMDVTLVTIFVLGSTISGVIGARLFWWIAHIKVLIQEPLFGLRRVGFVSWGVIAGFFLFIAVFSLWGGYPFLLLTDTLFCGMFIAYAIGRIGCLTYGCCYGIVTDTGGISFHNPESKVNREKNTPGVQRYPTQILSAIHGIILFIVLNILFFTGLPVGVLTVLAMMYFSIGRFVEEFYRDRRRIDNSVFTEGHIGCLLLFISGWGLAFIINSEGGAVLQRWTAEAINQSMSIIPVTFLLGLILFFIMGFHWRKIGSW